MDYEAGEYRRLPVKQYPAREIRETAEGAFWRRFREQLTAKQFGAVTSVEFFQQQPHHLAVTSSTRVTVYDAASRSVRRTFSRFKDKAYSGSFRKDGKLLVAGGEEGIVQVFDANSRSVLRQLKGHARPVHVTRFGGDRAHVLSGGDDAVVRWWDVAQGSQVARLDGHADYVRCAAYNPASPETWSTGGYDHMCKLWDVRSGKCILTLNHGHPVESLAFVPSGSMLVTAGGPTVCAWDLFSGGRMLQRMTSHQKTVTSVLVAPGAGPRSSAGPRIMSASLDGHVKVYDVRDFQVTYALKFPEPILSLALAPDCSAMAVGMAGGSLAIRRFSRPKALLQAPATGGAAAPRQRYKPRLTAASYRYFVRGQSSKAAEADLVASVKRKAALAPYDRLLRKFQYREALDAALATRRPEVVASVLQELAARGGLGVALAGRGAAALLPLAAHLRRHIADPRHAAHLAAVAHRLLDQHGCALGRDADVDLGLRQLHERVREEVRAQEELLVLQGMLEPLLAAAHAPPA